METLNRVQDDRQWKKMANAPGFRRHAFSPAALKQKAKDRLERLGGALFKNIIE